ncbi:hypothetical protein JCM19232_2525 [Vibrio ishigakensis]|uniref:Uncharacterized protein n=1 Tax=Vibrio ishigakensis TaxID=1481914 RepID=A0A0B8P9Q5_9VIBR|nr:hypothetical protein JCM19232_2525 [Vibrio ishigakensis]
MPCCSGCNYRDELDVGRFISELGYTGYLHWLDTLLRTCAAKA